MTHKILSPQGRGLKARPCLNNLIHMTIEDLIRLDRNEVMALVRQAADRLRGRHVPAHQQALKQTLLSIADRTSGHREERREEQ